MFFYYKYTCFSLVPWYLFYDLAIKSIVKAAITIFQEQGKFSKKLTLSIAIYFVS